MINKYAPADRRPYWLASQAGEERITHTMDSRQTWRQIGWHGQSGAFYGLDEDPSAHEPGSFGPLWLLVDDEPPIFDHDEDNR